MKIGNISGIYPNGYALKNTKNNLQNNKVEYSNANFLNKNASDAIKNNAVAMINFRGNNSKEIDKIVQKLKEYGIDAEFTNLPTAQLTLDAVEDFIKLNDKDIFKGLKIIPYKEDIDWIWGSSFNCDTHEYVIKLNNNFLV